jgi:hypothetical protein
LLVPKSRCSHNLNHGTPEKGILRHAYRCTVKNHVLIRRMRVDSTRLRVDRIDTHLRHTNPTALRVESTRDFLLCGHWVSVLNPARAQVPQKLAELFNEL